MKKLIIIFILLLNIASIFAKITEKQIKSGGFIYGYSEGKEKEKKQIDEAALRDLVSQISISIKSSFENKIKEVNGQVEESAELMIKTYSDVVLTGAQRLIIKSGFGKKVKIYRYVLKENVQKIFEGRKNKVLQYTRQGKLAQNNNQIGVSLKYYYWALILLNSLPDKNFVKYEDEALLESLKYRIENIINEIKFTITKKEESEKFVMVNVQAANDSGPILFLDLSYNDENTWIGSRVKDGKCVFNFTTDFYDLIDAIDVKIDYQNRLSLGQDKEVESLMTFAEIPFDNSKEIPKKLQKIKKNVVNVSAKRVEKSIIKDLLKSIKVKEFEDVKEYFTQEGFQQFIKIMNYGEVQLYDGKHTVEIFQYGKNRQIRSIPLIFKIAIFAKGLDVAKFKFIYDNIVLIFDENDKIAWVNFTISDKAFSEAVEKGNLETGNKKKDLEERMMGINFMEYYKTLFSLKDADRIENLFRDDAKIFVGYIKKSVPVAKDLKDILELNMSQDEIVYKEFGKKEYMHRLRNMTFLSPYLNIQFSNMKVANISDRGKPIYSLQLKQDFYSTYYSDEGYLLLFTDYTDRDNPKIFYRYWAPNVIDEEYIQEVASEHSF